MKRAKKSVVFALLAGTALAGSSCLEKVLYHALVIQVSDEVGAILPDLGGGG
jgi:hypothetical protein